MNALTKSTLAVLAVLGCSLTTALPAQAAGAQRVTIVEDTDEYWSIPAGENPCGPGQADIHEIRHSVYKGVLAPGGQVEGEIHINGSVQGSAAIDPDGAVGPLPTFSGTYREKDNVIVISENDDLRTMNFRLREVATAADGRQLLLVLSGKVTLNAHGVVTVDRSVNSCTFL